MCSGEILAILIYKLLVSIRPYEGSTIHILIEILLTWFTKYGKGSVTCQNVDHSARNHMILEDPDKCQ